MRIVSVRVENFRLFEHREFRFHPEFNLVIGENGAGKTSLLKALAACVSPVLDELGAENPEVFALTDEDVSDRIITIEGETRYEKAEFVCLEGEWRHDDGQVTWCRNKYYSAQSRSGSLIGEGHYKNLCSFDPNWSVDLNFHAPLLAFYGCGRLWSPKPEDGESKIRNAMEAKYQRRDGYVNWSQSSADDSELMLWLLKQDIISYQEKNQPLGWRLFSSALAKCFDNFDKLSFIAKDGDLVVHYTDGKAKLFKHMSDGQRAMIGLIGDIVRRTILLNPQLGEKLLDESYGVVLIDELDLHLHPKWQRRIIGDLRKTFPKIQFICTTHSPQLIGQVKPEELIVLDEGVRGPSQTYGMDSNWILRHVMDSQDRDPIIAGKLDALFDDIEEARFESARQRLQELRGEMGEHPELIEADALISRYTRFDQDDEVV